MSFLRACVLVFTNRPPVPETARRAKAPARVICLARKSIIDGIVAMSSTFAGNLTLIGSVANLIVV